MHADIQGVLARIDKTWRSFTHRDKPMSKAEVLKVMKYAAAKGYKYTSELSDEEVDNVLASNS